jgi:hypothetical protein
VVNHLKFDPIIDGIEDALFLKGGDHPTPPKSMCVSAYFQKMTFFGSNREEE